MASVDSSLGAALGVVQEQLRPVPLQQTSGDSQVKEEPEEDARGTAAEAGTALPVDFEVAAREQGIVEPADRAGTVEHLL